MMNVNVQGLRRNVKNVVKNYTDAQVKVREATSNDAWGPPSSLMGEIADLTYNVVAFTEIMQIIWKRLNDNGKNWRHVYKALVLLEYLIKVGSERVASQCKENIFAIQTLKDFQYVEDNKDQGMNVREKSKTLVSLLKDDERLRQERARALKAKERFAQNTIGTSADMGSSSRRAYSSDELASPRDYRAVLGSSSELESARPQTAGEEELQLQLALAMSKEEAEQEERQRKNDDLRLQMALTESQQAELSAKSKHGTVSGRSSCGASKSCIDDLLGLSLASSDPWGLPPPEAAPSATSTVTDSLVGAVGGADPWAPALRVPATAADPWAPQPVTPPTSDPWTTNSSSESKVEIDEFDLISRPRLNNVSPGVGNHSLSNSPAFDLSGMSGVLPKTNLNESANSKMRKTPESFLGPNSNLVNLDALVTVKPVNGPVNPFGTSSSNAFIAPIINPTFTAATTVAPPQQNPFQALNKPPTMNELRGESLAGFEGLGSGGTPVPGSVNPFL